ncbi:MAG TPA: GNAT family N-acetyltransferase [Rhizobium sp.]|jgi:putative acetyltransferase|nr:GNAT family N-acetyltransferase [Rhizobium sp.]
MDTISIRLAAHEDSAAIANVFTLSRKTMTFLPALHTASEDREFIANCVLVEKTVHVAILNDEIVGFIAFGDGWVDHLYVAPNHTAKQIGTLLLQSLLADAPSLRLWTFQKNDGARRFYERFGFIVEAETDGADNEEKEPDILYVWHRQAS